MGNHRYTIVVRKACILHPPFFSDKQTITTYYNNCKQSTQRLKIAFQVPFKQTWNLYQGKLIRHCKTMSTKITSSAQFIVFQVFWNTALPLRPPKDHFGLRGLSLGFYTFFWLPWSCKLSTLGMKFLNMSNITPVSLPSAGLYCDFTPPLVHNFVRFWMKRRV